MIPSRAVTARPVVVVSEVKMTKTNVLLADKFFRARLSSVVFWDENQRPKKKQRQPEKEM
jgi:hypothetical protein